MPENYGVTPDASIPSNYLENRSLTVALVETSSLTGGSVTGAEVVLDAVALNDGGAGDTFFFGAPIIGSDGPFFPAGAPPRVGRRRHRHRGRLGDRQLLS